MKRFVVLVLSLAVFLTLGMNPAGAAKPERYRSQAFNAYWNSRQRIDRNTYDRTQWYAGVYSSGDRFFSDLYKNVERCTRRAGHSATLGTE